MTVPKIAIQVISTGGVYGAERALLELAQYLAEHGWESRVVALEGAGAADLVREAESRGLAAEAFVTGGRLALLPMIARLRALLGRYPPAILHSHGYKPDILLRWLGVTRRTPCIATCHNWISNTRKMKFLETLDKRSLRGFQRVVAVSSSIAQELKDAGVPADRVSVIDNGIGIPQAEEEARSAVRAELGIEADDALLVHIGRLAGSKRIDVLLEAVARVVRTRPVRLLLVGEGEQRPALTELASRLGLAGRVHLCGYRNDVGRLLKAADLMVLSSEREGLPIVILEAMAVRCPIVATRVGAIANVLEDGEHGWLVSTNDIESLSRAIEEALANPGLAADRARHAHERFLARYGRDSMGARYLQLYEDLWSDRLSVRTR